ncbi:hypothetical protein CSKR_100658 [Clonorchis sinensis]|uniref:E3 ubiquitin-protein ligase TRIM56 n=2 Tax=Clonorchis sinensis TaxID=79923 RepID=H2KNI3_CLOSI|nr:hypothetical protein CSKR_100658 [Clonorchis sinensis]GAA30484.2 E3 ubiquitin-protein ligase TRIM56 [Clonorchis sinensis]
MEIRRSLEANFLTCKQCHQPYQKPKVLVCLHTFCQSCLEKLVAQKEAENEAKELESAKRYYTSTNLSSNDYRSSYRKKWSSKFRYGDYDSTNYGPSRYTFNSTRVKQISCPVCEKETAIPAGGVVELPTDQLADRLASMVDRMPTFPVCDVCTKQLLLSEEAGSPPTPTSKQNSYKNGERFADSDDSDSGEYEDMSSFNGSSSRTSQLGDRSSRQRPNDPCNNIRRPRRRTVPGGYSKSTTLNGPQPASAACLECAKRLCVACRETHSKMAVTAAHVLIRAEQMEDLQCSRHPRELRRFFCVTCRMYICIVCTFETSVEAEKDPEKSSGHANHDIMSIREAVTAYQEQLSRESAATQAHIQQIESLLNSLQVCESEMRCLYAAIDAGVKACIDQLQRQQSALKAKVDKVAGIPLEVLTSECKRLNNAANEWYDFLNDDRITSRLDLMDPIEALTEAGPMLDRVNHCLRLASEPLNKEMARQPFLLHLKAAESHVLSNGDSGLVSSQSSSPPSNSDSIDSSDHGRANYWRSRLGKFQPGSLDLGRIVTQKELAAELLAESSKRVTTYVQTGPELIKALPPPKGAQRHRAVQINLLGANLDDRATQTDPVTIGVTRVAKLDSGTQYASSDVNPPVSMYRTLKQILVQK